ncbi:two-component system, chemotaxis family, response regulator CheY [Geoalkalibacter ferrihydriticus]|uniref:Response regulatory domain-containing protein n=2 Tax=Geoalkalibacter ferrihydriticus TaxID=392333 RepID=A0A0C2DWG5_9BACT|nr:response regulator [Geoalkalibacter ferrihydriticus]KIH77789.1 hypothetical protein GFER_03875 [Geoalkalibacter ferrihydriticus DSM 17813]SDL79307.1 two-component system, chemotaxis family, response regulator CheY [Geoalkalibacter ferrihydriticus]
MSLKILIVDDALFMRNLLRGVLEGGGHQVVGEAGDGAAAVQSYRDLRPDLVMMDIVMPDKTGIQALREIMAEDPAARVVICSALGQDALVMEAVQGGARDFIVKPFKDAQVLEVVARVAMGG